MKNSLGMIAVIVIALAGGFAIGHHKPPVVIHPPAVIIHDTVKSIDTVSLTKTIYKTVKPDTVWLTHETVSQPETISVVPNVAGLTKLKLGEQVGDTGFAYGFHSVPLGNGKYAFNGWHGQWVTPGPLATLLVDSSGVKVGFFDPVPPPCSIGDKAKWAGFGAGGITLLRAILGK